MKNILIITQDKLVSLRQMKNHNGVTDDGKYRFFINDMNCNPHFVVIKGKGIDAPKHFDVPRSRTILVTCEPYGILDYPKGYCSQFGTVLACQRELRADKLTQIFRTQAILPWFVGAIFEQDGTNRFTMSYSDISNATPQKSKLISVISSKKAYTKGHVQRLRFIDRLQEYYGDKVDVFGHGFNDFDDKWDVLAPYKYHIVIENSNTDFYWTEKLSDCFLAGTYPLYYGCTNIDTFFPKKALTPININNFNATAAIIDNAIAEDLYTQRISDIEQSKRLVLDKYNMFNAIADACDSIKDTTDNRNDCSTVIRPASDFFSLHNFWLHTVGWNINKLRSKL